MQVSMLENTLVPAPELYLKLITAEARLYLRLGYSGLEEFDYRMPLGSSIENIRCASR